VEFFVGVFVGLVWWQIAMVSCFFGVVILTAFAESGWSIPTFVVAICSLWFFDKIDFSHINYGLTFMFMASYLVIGVVWSGYKWFLYVKAEKADYDAKCIKWYERQSDNFQKAHSIKEIDFADLYSSFTMPKSSRKTEEISVWILFWEFSIFSYFFSDMIVDLIKRLGGMYDMIARYAIK
jgi:hypothetical protein